MSASIHNLNHCFFGLNSKLSLYEKGTVDWIKSLMVYIDFLNPRFNMALDFEISRY